jgi:microcystin-dependent protein
MSDQFVAEIRILPTNFAPTGWAFCDGQILPISQNTALFSLLGTFYGGDGRSNFALPNLQGSAPMQQGQGSGLTNHDLGEASGTDYVTLLDSEMPIHTHTVLASADDADLRPPAPSRSLGASANGNLYALPAGQSLGNAAFQAIPVAGGSLPHNNLQPYLTLNFVIALQGVFPPRS